MSGKLVLVTGGSGFIATYCILKLLQAGYHVRATVRSLKCEPDVRADLIAGGAKLREMPPDTLSFAVADLLSDNGWEAAVAGCTYVLHVASPNPAGPPKHENDLIIPAREGTLRVLKAAHHEKVKRVVLTSSFAAIGYGNKEASTTLTEETWTNPNQKGVSAYAKSKTLAEMAAWDWIASQGGSLELAVINPVMVCGPLLGSDLSMSVDIVKKQLDGALPGLPHVYMGVVDVRDVADLHLRAMTSPNANGQRFLAVAGDFMSLKQIAQVLKTQTGTVGRRVTTRELPDWLVRFFALFMKPAQLIVPDLGVRRNASGDKAKNMLGWVPRPREEAIVATATSMQRLGLLRYS